MTARVPSATPRAIGYVSEYQLAFHKRSIDGSAKADALRSGNGKDRLWGAVYQIHLSERPMLDRHEFLGIGYDRIEVNVVTSTEVSSKFPTKAWMYVARSEAIDRSLKPYCWYMDYIIRGAYQHRLPLCHISQLHQIEPLTDPDRLRIAEHRQLLAG
jgi:gamma-glutamylcyclotransferase (GGCT)/AIG2-like uncharacterized protein YtfP